MVTLEIYEPPVGCGVGTCGPDAEDELNAFNAVLELLEARGATVCRYNLGIEPEAFSGNAMVKAAIKERGIACLPFIFVDGKLVSEGRYASADDLRDALGALLPQGQ